MSRVRAVAVALVVGWAVSAQAGARRYVLMRPDASGRRPELPLYGTAALAKSCRDSGTRPLAQPPSAPAPAAKPSDAADAPCASAAPLRHDTAVELLPPPGACGDGFSRVRVLDGNYRGRTGCVRSDALRVPGVR